MDEAWEELLRLIEHREMSPAEIRRRLRRRGHPVRACEAALRKARRLGLIDEGRLAQAIAEARSEGAPRGLLRVQSEFERRGIAGETAEKALGAVDDSARCREAAEGFLRRRGRPQDPADWRRLAGWLLRRGHLEESIRDALRSLGMEWPEDADAPPP